MKWRILFSSLGFGFVTGYIWLIWKIWNAILTSTELFEGLGNIMGFVIIFGLGLLIIPFVLTISVLILVGD